MNSFHMAAQRLQKLGIDGTVIDAYYEPHRFYHNWTHIDQMLTQAADKNILTEELFLAIVFHDIVYQPGSTTNEKDSAMLFKQEFIRSAFSTFYGQMLQNIYEAIIDTKDHRPTPNNQTSIHLCQLDLWILDQPLPVLIEFENKIFKEYQQFDYEQYKPERMKALSRLAGERLNHNVRHLVSYIECRKPNIAVYAGSFDPFHKGHLNILEKAEKIFDKVILAQGRNPGKEFTGSELPDSLKYRQRAFYSTLLTTFINSLGYDVTLVRGLRSTTDLQYEITQYRYLQALKPGIKVVSIFCDSEFEHISSSGIKQIESYGTTSNYKVT